MQTTKSALVAAVMVALSSCGGGGGGGGSSAPAVPTTPLGITANNAASVAGEASLAGLGASAFGSLFEFAVSVPQAMPRTHVLTNVVRQAIGLLTANLQSATPINGAATTTTSNCAVSGTNSVTGDPVAGTATVTFNNCSDIAGESLNGSFSAVNIQIVTNASFSATAAINLGFTQTGVPPLSISASGVGVSEIVNTPGASDTITLTGQLINATSGSVAEQLGAYNLKAVFTAASETDTITLTYASTSIGGLVNVTTGTPCVTVNNFPQSGVLNIAGAAGTKLRVTVNGDETHAAPQVSIGVDANGDGAFETTLNQSWTQLDIVN